MLCAGNTDKKEIVRISSLCSKDFLKLNENRYWYATANVAEPIFLDPDS